MLNFSPDIELIYHVTIGHTASSGLPNGHATSVVSSLCSFVTFSVHIPWRTAFTQTVEQPTRLHITMRLSLAVLVALGRLQNLPSLVVTANSRTYVGASVPATAIRIITLSGAPVENLHAFDTVPAKDIHWDAGPAPQHRPCNKAKGYTSSPGPLGTLLSHFGLASPREENPPDHGSDADEFGEMVEVWKHHVADMMQDAENKIIPLMEGGVIRILPVTNEAGGRDMDAKNKHLEHAVWKSLEGKEGIRHVHHGHHKAHSFGGRYVFGT